MRVDTRPNNNPRPTVRYDADGDLHDYRDTTAFQCYAKLVLRVLMKAKEPLSIRAIHEALGDSAERRYTADVLENPSIEQIPGYIDRYQMRTRFVKELRHVNITQKQDGSNTAGITISPKDATTPYVQDGYGK